MSSSPVLDFLTTNAWRLPYLLVWLVGAVLALVFWRRHPLASGLSLAAFVVLLVDMVLAAAFFWFVNRNPDFAPADRGRMFAVGNACFSLICAGARVLLLTALFARRPQPAPPPRYERPGLPDEARDSGDQPPETAIRPPY